VSGRYTLAKFRDWQTYGAGTWHGRERHSCHAPVSGGGVSVHGSPGTYMVDPVADSKGRHRGYRVLFCDAGGDLAAAGLQRGLYAEVAGPVTLPVARRAVREHFERTFGALGA
jgi:hypothetical protein